MAVVRLWMLLLLAPLHIFCDHVPEGTGMFSPSDDIEYAAIKTIHKQLDDNADGSVDFSESAEFVQTELCGSPIGREEIKGETACTGSEKSLKFHQTDTQITSTELWVTWHKNEVFNWTNQDVLNWLEHYVELPEYSSAFIENQITGRHLPHIAINSGQILQNSLSITDGQHKQKIQLRAMDVILFGPPVQRRHWKDTILEISVVVILCGTIYALWQRRRSKTHMDSFMEDLRLKEEEIKRLTSKFEAIERESTDGPANECQEEIRDPSPPIMMSASSSSEEEDSSISRCKSCNSSQALDSLSQAQQNMELLQQRVWLLEEELDVRNRSYHLLQQLLPECQQKEREQLEFRKSVGEEQMARAQRVCDKIRKRRSSLFGSFHLANSSVLEEAGLQITKAVNKMQLLSEYFEEHHKRWNRIAHACGFQVSSPGCKSPVSQSPRESNPFTNHRDMLRFRYTNRSVFHYGHAQSELFHSSSSSPHFTLQSNPQATGVKLYGQSVTLPQGTTPKSMFRDQKRHSMSVVPRDLNYDRSMTDSVESVSSSSGSSASQLSGLVMTNTRLSISGRANGEVEEVPQRACTDGGASERGSREGSVDSVRGSGGPRSQSGEKKVVTMNRMRSATTTSEEVGQSSTEKVRPSPRDSPRQQSQGSRSRVKLANFNSTNV